MTQSRLSRVAVILVEPQDPVNIAATVRAMKNMGVSELRLVRPVAYEPHRLEGIAHNTRDLIDSIRRFDSFDEAAADCIRLAAFTARRRAAKWRVIPPEGSRDRLARRCRGGNGRPCFRARGQRSARTRFSTGLMLSL